MLISEAIDLAAAHIEEHPRRYNFNQGAVLDKNADREGATACMLARLGQVAGFAYGTNCDTVARALLGVSANVFYDRIMREAGRPLDNYVLYATALLPDAMRSYARKYHGIPQEVRALFDDPAQTKFYQSFTV